MSKPKPKVAVLAGEASGDHLGASLIEGLLKKSDNLELAGIGGEKMLATGMDCWWHSDELAVFGLIEVLQHIPRLIRMRRQLLNKLLHWKPDIVVSIDAPDFYLPLAAHLKKHSVPVIHYVCPSVWAWRQNRVKIIRNSVDHVLCLLPFEKQFLTQHNVPASFVGHPMANMLKPLSHNEQLQRRQDNNMSVSDTIVAVLPGSRQNELQRHSVVFLKACQQLQNQLPQRIKLVSAFSQQRHMQEFLDAHSAYCPALDISIQPSASDALQLADIALLASGTVTLEAMLCRCPMVVGYILNPLTWQIMHKGKLYKAEHIALPNLLAKQRLVPELLQHDANPVIIMQAMLDILKKDNSVLKAHFSQLSSVLTGSAEQPADVVWQQLQI